MDEANLSRRTYQVPRGTHDILPSEIPAWRWLEETFRALCARYNYHEIRTPMFESTELFTRSVGASSDILVTKQMYTFTAPDENSYTLRPEGTAPAVRAYLEHHLSQQGPVTKLFYVGPIFRYEAPQAGRYRQHHQCGIELLGAPGPEADAEVLALASDFLTALQISAPLHLNSLGTPESRGAYLQILRAYLEPLRASLSEDSQKRLDINPLRIFDSKDEGDKAILQRAPHLLDYLQQADPEAMQHFTRLCGYLDDLGIAYTIDHSLVRGFDYYTHTVFEFISDQIGAQGTVLAGGRYDRLVEELGGPATAGIGFGSGIERLLQVSQATTPAVGAPLAFLVTQGDAARAASVGLLHKLRAAGIPCDCDFLGRRVKRQLGEASRQGARFALILGDDELAQGTIAMKDQEAGNQEVVPLETAIERLRALVGA